MDHPPYYRFLLGTFVLSGVVMFHTAFATPQKRIEKPSKRPPVSYTQEVRPILAEKCFSCHGADEKKRMANLRLDTRDGAIAHRAVVSGHPEKSTILARILRNDGLRMPPTHTGKKVTQDEVEIIKRWITQGAKYAPHWAFQRPQRVPLPKTANQRQIKNPIDNFVFAKLEQIGLTPNPTADKYTLVRRVSLDLTGLPPTPQEVQTFASDTSPNAYEKLVDRLLASPQYGEKWARMWMDIARYADSAGYGSDPLRPNLWPYRDWVINAFNNNMPFDRFTIEQLAGDLLPNPTQEQLAATTFHRNTMTNTEGGTDREEFRTAAVKDRAIVTMQAWMGVTVGCAQCHNHKYDPVTQKDFYRFLAFFNQTEDNDQPDERPTIPYLTSDLKRRKEALQVEVAELTSKNTPEAKAEIEKKNKEIEKIFIKLPVMKELPTDKQRKSHILILGNFLSKAEEVQAGTPTYFPALPADAPKNRLGVALWLTNRENPLTARVAVNRFWATLFGRGIVETEEDFGQQGSLPSHLELLDWLALEFMEGGWNVKNILKTLVTSATYRQSARTLPSHLEKDPRDRLLSRYPRRRLDAEGVRDQALLLSGMLSHKLGGPSVFPPQPDGLWRAAFNGERTWSTSVGEDRYRRGLYTFWRRTVPYPSMATFDAPSRETCTLRRIPTNTPLQALITLNDPVYLELAQALGRRIAKEGGNSLQERMRFALLLVQCKPATETQVQTLTELYNQELEHFRKNAPAAKTMATQPLGDLPAGMDVAEQAAWTVVANVLLNLDSVLTIG